MSAWALAGALGSSILGGLFNKGQVDSTNRQNRDLMIQEQNWNLDMWNRQNAYNTPAHQMELMRSAGLNPAAADMLGDFTSGTVNSAAAPTMQPYQFGMGDISQLFTALAGNNVAEKKIDLEGKKVDLEAYKADAYVQGILSQIEKNGHENNLTDQQIEESKSRVQNLWQQIEESKSRVDKNLAGIKLTEAQTQAAAAAAARTIKLTDLEYQNLAKELDLKEQQVKNLIADLAQTVARTQLLGQEFDIKSITRDAVQELAKHNAKIAEWTADNMDKVFGLKETSTYIGALGAILSGVAGFFGGATFNQLLRKWKVLPGLAPLVTPPGLEWMNPSGQFDYSGGST